MSPAMPNCITDWPGTFHTPVTLLNEPIELPQHMNGAATARSLTLDSRIDDVVPNRLLPFRKTSRVDGRWTTKSSPSHPSKPPVSGMSPAVPHCCVRLPSRLCASHHMPVLGRQM